MKIFSWNCQGLGNPLTVGTLRDWCWRERPNIVFVMETMIKNKELERIRNTCGFTSGLCVSSRGRSGGLGFWWRDIDAQLITYDAHHIMVDILDDSGCPMWRAVGVYGWPEICNKHKTWEMMRRICDSVRTPIILFGDFNEILSIEENEGRAIRRESQMDAFRETMDDCALHDLGYKGNIFTWQSGRGMHSIVRERLDRAVASTSWSLLFPNGSVYHFPIYSSDHSAIVIRGADEQRRNHGRRSFKFEPFWLSDTQCQEVVKSAWSEEGEGDVFDKVNLCAVRLTAWARERFGNIRLRIREKEAELGYWQRQAPSADMLTRCAELVKEVDELRRQVETYWYSRARKCELRDGDKNTGYFHFKAKQRKSRNWISGIEDERGQWCTQEADVTRVVEEYFRQLFCSSNPFDSDEVLESIPLVVSDEMNQGLDRQVSDDEIKDAIFSMHPNKAPGPDRMHALFYQKHWGIVGDDICRCVREWWEGRGDISRLNMTNVVLIPKCKSPKKITEYRPISLCNRFHPPGGLIITDNALIAFEIFHTMKRGGEGRNGHVTLKLDMSKAYDRVEWSFLDEVMRRMGFSQSWRNKIMTCVSTVTFSFLVNGKASGALRPSRGLRQGDPISPYLFLLCADAFSHLLNRAVAEGKKINYSKSEVVFSKKVPSHVRELIIETLGVREVERHENLKERVWKKVQGWKEKLLSKPGKEVLIKAVAQAIPTYMMSLFPIPEGGSSESQRKIHWWRWEKLCKPKACGGMGFRDMRVFNQALLAKQVWRLLVNPESLVGRVLKARYFKHGSILDARRGYDPSFAWRSLWGAKSLLLDGLQWQVGNGESIRVWEDAWLPGVRGRKVPRPNIEADPSMRVASLIDAETGTWREEEIRALFTEDEANRVYEIPLSKRRPEDQLFWWPSKSGVYSVKSGYWLGMGFASTTDEQQLSEQEGGLWRTIWGLRVPPKLTHFLWRACTGMLGLCGFCEQENETEIHAVFTCSWTRTFWAMSGFSEQVAEAPLTSFPAWLLGSLQRLGEALWTIRNSRIFDEDPINPTGYASKVGKQPLLFHGVGGGDWQPPGPGTIKLNSDAAIFGDGEIGMGVVGRDETGRVVMVASKRVRARMSPELAEMKAMIFGLEVARRMGMTSISVETDALSVAQAIQKEVVRRGPIGLCLYDISSLAKSFVFKGLCTVIGEELVLVSDFPQTVLNLAELDSI
ncbi:hypothetical protein RND81_09G007000 [Saponaria officinalis]|uniref:Reverse transcriptase domain-containing protein n=1 Tax=Saponaria officinalis TaxID=3572 RepID=A0AAW1IH90_SAPOF